MVDGVLGGGGGSVLWGTNLLLFEYPHGTTHTLYRVTVPGLRTLIGKQEQLNNGQRSQATEAQHRIIRIYKICNMEYASVQPIESVSIPLIPSIGGTSIYKT